MSADLVTSMAGESEESRGQREQFAKQLDVLTKGSDTCKRFIGVRLLGKIAPACPSSPEAYLYAGELQTTILLNQVLALTTTLW